MFCLFFFYAFTKLNRSVVVRVYNIIIIEFREFSAACYLSPPATDASSNVHAIIIFVSRNFGISVLDLTYLPSPLLVHVSFHRILKIYLYFIPVFDRQWYSFRRISNQCVSYFNNIYHRTKPKIKKSPTRRR